MILIGLFIGLAIGILLGYLFLKNTVLKNSLPVKDIEERYVSKELYADTAERLKAKELDLNRSNSQILELNTQLATLRSEKESQQEKLNTLKLDIENLHTQSREQFKNLANEILEEKSQKFTSQNKENIDAVMTPLRERIKEFQEKVENVYKIESTERNTLKGEITTLVDLNKKISEQANNLANALKGDSKTQGNWGEVILERALERSGLEKDKEYRIQYSLKNIEGDRLQPDVVVFLPNNKHIIIDSKVSLTAYEAFVSAPTEEEKKQFLLRHLVSVKKHIDELSKKDYQSLININTLDFVLLFMPIESSFSIALQSDNELFNYAWDRKIVIVSPTTLLATLYTIASLWRQEKQARNVFEIAEESGKLYDKFHGLIEDLLDVGKKMNSAKLSYDEAMKKASSGPGNIVKRIENIKKLGAKTTKSLETISTDLVNKAQEE
ncbi:MAG TPA: DNA recombination protein RmuC [Bacteroidia bacterium]|jgi:DNA recombination protein RmuC|nr:DNA recombination protein RmuC [Bacteroidia bacterium]